MMNVVEQLRSNGFRVMPVNNRKVPTTTDWNKENYQEVSIDKGLIGLVCGSFSQGLEVIDVDTKVLSSRIVEPFKKQLLSLLNEDVPQLSIYETMSGGLHILYRCNNYAGNMKLSQPLDEWTDKPTKEALFETRGQGGYVMAYLDKHIAGNTYNDIQKITDDKRDDLIEICRKLGKQPPSKKEVIQNRKVNAKKYTLKGLNVIDYIKAKLPIESVLSNEFTFFNPDAKGNVNVLRDGSKAAKSGTIFHNNKTGSSLYLHSTGTQYPANQMLDVIEILAIQQGCEQSNIINHYVAELKSVSNV